MTLLIRKIYKKLRWLIFKYIPYFYKLSQYSAFKKKSAELTHQLALTKKAALLDNDAFQIRVVNLNATDVCNSGCTMCNIWQQKQDKELSPYEFQKVLEDPLFDAVTDIGVTGGEPTLRADLPQIYESIIKGKPDIRGLSIITNCIDADTVIERVERVWDVTRLHNKEFSMMVSLDGFGDVHDRVRGTAGNFYSAIKVINYFNEKGLTIATGTTISKMNVWEVDEVLDFLRKNKLYGRFRVAEFIKRLYNDSRSDDIRNFDEDESYHLILFFYKLIFTFETNENFQRTYYSIINILSGGKRLIACPYHANGVVLNSRGEIAYCAPKSKILGNALTTSAIKLYAENVSERQQIKDNFCNNCIHDYHAPITDAEKLLKSEKEYWREFVKLDSFIPFSTHKKVKAIHKTGQMQIFITGWYGTETVGDKAILGGIINELQSQYSNDIGFVISSLYPLITRRTLVELGIDALVIDAFSSDFVAYAKGSDLVIMGGGPLMDLEVLALPLYAFRLAKLNGRKTQIFGCGLGPLHDARYIIAVKKILHLADKISLRDKSSVELAKEWTNGKKEIKQINDPAKLYLQSFKDLSLSRTRNSLNCYLRELTHEYAKDKSLIEFQEVKSKFEASLASFILRKAQELHVDEIVFDHMHNFVVGNDDRDFSRYFIDKFFSESPIPVSYNKRLSTVESVTRSMQESSYTIAMRFHSVVFAHTLDVPFTAIDYTNGGKISNYLNDNRSVNSMISISEIVNKY